MTKTKKARSCALALVALTILPAAAQPSGVQDTDVQALRQELEQARQRLEAQERRLQALEQRLAAGQTAVPTAQAIVTVPMPNDGVMPVETAQIERVGEQPLNFDRPPEVSCWATRAA